MYKSMGGCLFSASQCLNKCSCNVSQCLDTCSCSASQRLWTGAHAVAPRWGAADAEIKVPSDEDTELQGSPFKTWSRSVYIAMHASLTARDFFPANFYPSGPFTCIFPKPLPSFSCVSCGKHQFLRMPAE